MDDFHVQLPIKKIEIRNQEKLQHFSYHKELWGNQPEEMKAPH